jgi:hypothetical protein
MPGRGLRFPIPIVLDPGGRRFPSPGSGTEHGTKGTGKMTSLCHFRRRRDTGPSKSMRGMPSTALPCYNSDVSNECSTPVES